MPWVAGQSGNVSGRPPGFKGVARKIMGETRDGAELVEFALRVFRDETADMRDRQAMHAWLSDRGLGKPLQQVDLHATAHALAAPDPELAALSVDELRARLAAARAAQALLPAATDENE